jgi:ATP-dependent RNA helicase DDX49/DBP8
LFFQDIALNETDFDERRNINKRKKLIREGRDPDMEDEVRQKKKKENLKAFKRQKKNKDKLKAETAN